MARQLQLLLVGLRSWRLLSSRAAPQSLEKQVGPSLIRVASRRLSGVGNTEPENQSSAESIPKSHGVGNVENQSSSDSPSCPKENMVKAASPNSDGQSSEGITEMAKPVDCGEQHSGEQLNLKNTDLFKPFEAEVNPTDYQEGSFQHLFEKSKFARALNPVGKEVEADIIAIVGDKLYVDFGCKFHAVVTCPDTLKEYVRRGTKVIVLVEDLEVTLASIGAPRHDSLLEAKATFVRLVDHTAVIPSGLSRPKEYQSSR